MGKQACKWKTTARDKRHLLLIGRTTSGRSGSQMSKRLSRNTHTHAYAFGMSDFHTQMEMQQTSDYKKRDD